ncbi:kinase-like domain-containing protein [Xylaria sp. FL0043]|nr:kinase-like domain-containing protein [Xylaria sp. FL0043]
MATTEVNAALEALTAVTDPSPAQSPAESTDADSPESPHAASRGGTGTGADVDLSRYALILGNFINLPDVAKLSENARYLFVPPKGDDNWKGGLSGDVCGPFLALEIGEHMYSAEGWMIGSSSNTDLCDIQVAVAGDKSGISRRHLRIDIDVRSKSPRVNIFTDRSSVRIIIHEKNGDRQRVLAPRKAFTLTEFVPITVDFGTSHFQAWRPILGSPGEKTRYLQRVEKHFKEYMDSVPTIPSIRSVSGAETMAVRFGQDGGVYQRDTMGNLGKGSNATVYRVVDVTSGEVYAAKEPYYKSSDPASKVAERFQDLKAEYKKLVELKHPNIVRPVELLLVDNDKRLPPWLIMEYFEHSLEDLRLSMKDTNALIAAPQIIEAVAFIHEMGYTHRDIKPGNIFIKFVNNQPVVKVGDVGTMKNAVINLETFAGTPDYMAPECWSKKRQYGKEIDMWAVGLVLLQLFTHWHPSIDTSWANVPPFGRQNKLGFTAWIRDVLMPFVATAKPQPVQDLLKGLLSRSPDQRWTASRCQAWVKENISPHVNAGSETDCRPTRRDFHQQADNANNDHDRRRKIPGR